MTYFEEDAMPPKAKAESYWWFGPETVEPLKERLAAAGSGARLEVRLHANDKLWLRIVPAGVTSEAAAGNDLNESHICPPICP